MDIVLSLCMIVRDEERFLANCLKHVREIADEIIIVDTGSVDRTREIALAWGARVSDWTWNGDFAAARNYGLEQASGDWILWLDADEELDAGDARRLKALLAAEAGDFVALRLVHYYGATPNPDESYGIAQTRVFRNGRGVRFQNRIHEALVIREPAAVTAAPIRVHHYGYMANAAASAKKLARNLAMLSDEIDRGNDDPWIPYHLASEYMRAGQYERSFTWVNLSIRSFLEQGTLPPALLYKLKYAVLLALGSTDGAWPGIRKAIALYPDYVDLHYYEGLILFARERYAEALNAFSRCLELGETNPQYLILRGSGSFMAWYRLGRCQEKLGSPAEAVRSYRNALRLSPSFREASQALLRHSIPAAAPADPPHE